MPVDIEAYRWQLWDAAQAQSLALSNATTAAYNATVAARPGGIWTNEGLAGEAVSPNGSPIYSGSVSPGTFTSTGTSGSGEDYLGGGDDGQP